MAKNLFITTMFGLLATLPAVANETFPDDMLRAKVDSTEMILADTVKTRISKEEKNRNVMLNAEGNSGPRNVNIGLPFRGDIIILENDVPVVYYFWPTMPTYAWRASTSLGNMGLLSMAEGALLYGKVGNAVISTDREASRKFRGYAQAYVNSFGSNKWDVTLTGPLGKNGWGYTLGWMENFDRGNGVNPMYTTWSDRTTMIKLGLQKTYNKGMVRLLYKLVNSRGLTSQYKPLIYEGNGKTSELSNFDLGHGYYALRDGKNPYLDPFTGESRVADLSDDEYSLSTSHNIYLSGRHRFNKGWNLKYTAMFQMMNSPINVAYPLSIGITEPDQRSEGEYFTYQGTTKEYSGSTQMVINQMIPQSRNRYFVARAELTKKAGIHNLRAGLTYQFNYRHYLSYGGMYIQTVEENPSLLDWYRTVSYNGQSFSSKVTDDNGLVSGGSGGYGSYNHDEYSRTAIYLSDDFSPTKWLDLSLGVRLEHQNKHEIHSPYYTNETIDKDGLIEKDFNNRFNKVGTVSAVAKLTKNFGLLGDFTYNSWWDSYWEYTARDENGNPIAAAGEDNPRSTIGKEWQQSVINWGAGVFFNWGDKLSIVSKLTGIRKNKIKYTSATVTNYGAQNETYIED